MAQRSQSPDDGARHTDRAAAHPGNRHDSARPPRTRRGGDREPYPGAHTSSTGTPARGTRATSRPGGAPKTPRRQSPATTASSAPIPVTVWACGPDPIDTHQPWPVPIIESLTTAFTTPGGRVLLLAPDTAPDEDSAAPSGSAVDGAATGETSVTAAREAVRALDRAVHTLVFKTRPHTSVTPSQPFWADLFTDSTASPHHAALDHASSSILPQDPHDGLDTAGSQGTHRVDLVVASLPAHAATTVSLDRLALLAAEKLHFGGVLAVYTHSDCTQGRLVDPTGAIVAAAQHADLLYLQHIVALHTPIRDGRLHAAPTPAVAAEYDRTRHRTIERGRPAPHLRAHADVLVFAQPAPDVAHDDCGAPPPQTVSASATHGGKPGRGDRR